MAIPNQWEYVKAAFPLHVQSIYKREKENRDGTVNMEFRNETHINE